MGSRTDSTSFGQNQNYKKYDTFVGVCIGQLVVGLVAIVISCWLLFDKPKKNGGDTNATDASHFKMDAIAAIVTNLILSGLALMGISVAASELPLAFKKRETLLDVMKMDADFSKAAKLQKAHVWCSLVTTFVTYSVLFNYVNKLLHDLQSETVDHGMYMNAALVLYFFYFVQFVMSMIIVIANRAIVVAAFNKHMMPVSEQVKREEQELDNRDDDVFQQAS